MKSSTPGPVESDLNPSADHSVPTVPVAVASARRTRRFDPARRDRITSVALDVLAERGVAGLTQRVVADAADVPLGSVTYHFPTRDDLLLAAFTRFVEEQDAAYKAALGGVRNREELVDALVRVVEGGPGRTRSGVIGFELHLAALRDPRLQALTAAWTKTSRAILTRFMTAPAAADLDAYVEGLILHALVVEPPRTGATRASLLRLLEAAPQPEGPADA